jgi:hypothetical protein
MTCQCMAADFKKSEVIKGDPFALSSKDSLKDEA